MGIVPTAVCENKILNYRYAWENVVIMTLILMNGVGFQD